jgi:4-hydroxy 2-oxovalerate aldolase
MMAFKKKKRKYMLTYRVAEQFHLDPRDILVELGRMRMAGRQEDMIVDVAYQLAQEKRG